MGEPLRLHFSRLGVGATAGLVVAIVKYIGDDVDYATKLLAMDWPHIAAVIIGYGMLPIVLGAIGGWISNESTVPKIFWFALTAPVILAAAAGAEHREPLYLPAPGKAGWNYEQILPISPAFGAEALAADKNMTPTTSSTSSTESTNPFVYGFKLFLGQAGTPKYRLVVHSVLNDKAKAEAIAQHLNRDYHLPAPATVGERKTDNPYWPIVLDGWTTYSNAKKLKDAIKGMNLGFDTDDNPYISVEEN
jgi:hypothetical protein